jgi:hypothetical protein
MLLTVNLDGIQGSNPQSSHLLLNEANKGFLLQGTSRHQQNFETPLLAHDPNSDPSGLKLAIE